MYTDCARVEVLVCVHCTVLQHLLDMNLMDFKESKQKFVVVHIVRIGFGCGCGVSFRLVNPWTGIGMFREV